MTTGTDAPTPPLPPGSSDLETEAVIAAATTIIMFTLKWALTRFMARAATRNKKPSTVAVLR